MVRANTNRWRVMRPQRLCVRRWDDEVVVYDDRTGDTHILEDLTGQVLERLMHTSASADELTNELRMPSADVHGDSVRRQRGVTRILDAIMRLHRKGIVKPVLK
jgi:PqqD family protein of HPr-rel-A system